MTFYATVESLWKGSDINDNDVDRCDGRLQRLCRVGSCGGNNEDKGDDLKADLEESARDFFFLGDEIKERAVEHAQSDSNLPFEVSGNCIRLRIPVDDSGSIDTLRIIGYD